MEKPILLSDFDGVFNVFGNDNFTPEEATTDKNTYHGYSLTVDKKNRVQAGYLGKSVKALLDVDSSASMKCDKKIFNLVATEINTFLQSTKLRPITVLGLDTNLESVSRVTALEGVELRGGGGTELSSVFDWIDKCKKRDLPDIMVLLTDGEYNWQEFIEKSKKYPSITKIVVIVNNVESVASYARITLGSVVTVISAGKGI